MSPHHLNRLRCAALALALSFSVGAAWAQERSLRLLTRPLFAPTEVIEAFTRETGIRVELTELEDEELLTRLREQPEAFDLAELAQDRVTTAQSAGGLFKPLDLDRIDSSRLLPAMLDATRLTTSFDGKPYAVPHLWGTDGLVVDTRFGQAADLRQLCSDPAARIGAQPTRRTLIVLALARGLDPFAAYADPAAYATLMDQVVQQAQACAV